MSYDWTGGERFRFAVDSDSTFVNFTVSESGQKQSMSVRLSGTVAQGGWTQ